MNSTAGSTPTVPNVLRVTELKNVLVNSLSGSGSMISSKRRLMLDQIARSCTSSPRRCAHQLDAAVDVLVVELDALDRVLLAAAPVAVLEALRRAPRDGAELGVVVREGVDQRLGAVRDQRVARTRAVRR